MIKAFLFDYGGVVTAGGNGVELPARLAKILAVTYDEAFQLLHPAWDDYCRGKLSDPEFWDALQQKLGSPIPSEKRHIANKWEIMQPIPEMLELIKDLKSKGYRVGLLSNTIPATAEDIRKHGGYDLFDFTVLSYETGYTKPDPEIYQIAMDNLPGIEPSEVVFLDDQEKCLPPAQALGIQTIFVENPVQAIAAVHALL
jgi:putative hydrolase of the HAD superfamily